MSDRTIDPLPRIGPHIVLRRLRKTDLERFQAYRSDPVVGRFQGWGPMSSNAAVSFLQRMSTAAFGTVGEWLQIGIAERTTDHLIGDVGVCVRDSDGKHAELGYTLAVEWQGRGLGSEAVLEAVAMLFENTDITRVVAITDTSNHASVHLLERVGMKLTGTLNSVFRGSPCKEHVFAIARPDGVSGNAKVSISGKSNRCGFDDDSDNRCGGAAGN